MRLAFRSLVLLAVTPAGLFAQGLDDVKAHYTKYEYRIPMRDGVQLFTAVYVPKDDSQTYPILLIRTPYSVAPYGVDQYRTTSARRRCSPRRATSSSTRTCAAGWMSEGEFVNMRPHNPNKTGRRTSTRAPTPTTRSTGC